MFVQEVKRNAGEENIDEAQIAENLPEQEILIQSVCETMVPKLVAEDIPLLFSLLSDVFPNVSYTRAEMEGLKEEIRKVCAEEFLVYGEGEEQGAHWTEKVMSVVYFLRSHLLCSPHNCPLPKMTNVPNQNRPIHNNNNSC